MNDRWLKITLIVSLGVNLGVLIAFVIRSPLLSPFPAPPFPRGDEPPFLAELGLSPEQRQQILEARDRTHEMMLPLKKEIDARHMKIIEIMAHEEPDVAAAETLIREAGSLKTEIDTAIFREMIGLRAIFSPEQKEAFLKLLGHHFAHRKPGCGMGLGAKGGKGFCPNK
ncbi:MAG: periplasmic heavy metal sensor [Deltaproteobacteria bacterium]|nr:periplasmic heavy metal sensor [Deltaproteobacteria bacterium]